MIIIGILVLLGAAWTFDWRPWLDDKTRQHLCFGAAIALVPLWMLQAGVKTGLEVHFLGLTTLALLLGWRMGMLMASLSLLLVTAFGYEPWTMLSANLLLGVIIPLSASYLLFLITYSYLYRHLFVYIFVAGFFNAALTITLKPYCFQALWCGVTNIAGKWYLIIISAYCRYYCFLKPYSTAWPLPCWWCLSPTGCVPIGIAIILSISNIGLQLWSRL